MTAAPLPELRGSVRVTLPLRTVNSTNVREHWSRRAERTRDHRQTTALVVAAHLRTGGLRGPQGGP